MVLGRSAHRFLVVTTGIAVLCMSVTNVAAQSAQELNARLQTRSADYVDTVNEATTAGLFTGAAVGTVIGSVVSRNSGLGPLAGMVIGGAVGSIVGNIAGTQVADQKEEYARREDNLDRSIAQLRSGNTKLASLVDVSTQLVAVRKAELAQLKQAPDASAQRTLAAELATEVASLDRALAAATKTRDTLRANLANYQGDINPALSSELNRTTKQVSALQARRNELARMQKGL